jgi:hypothetical protein
MRKERRRKERDMREEGRGSSSLTSLPFLLRSLLPSSLLNQ